MECQASADPFQPPPSHATFTAATCGCGYCKEGGVGCLLLYVNDAVLNNANGSAANAIFQFVRAGNGKEVEEQLLMLKNPTAFRLSKTLTVKKALLVCF